jgi:EmrB/QacA subfamily drug resistance transporter
MTQGQVDYSRKWYVMMAVAMSTFLATIDGSIVNVALPTLVRDLNTEFAIVQWVVLAYLLTLATLLLSMGRLGDMIGKKPVFTSGLVVFTVGSVLCGLAPSIEWLVGFRVLQAVGAAMAFALSMAIVTEAFPPSERGKALGLSGTIVSIGIVVGPTLGGLLIDALSWHWIFFVNLPVGIVGTVLALRFIPAIRPVGCQRFDFAGAASLFAGLLALLLALTLGQGLGFGNWLILVLFGAFAILIPVFVTIERRSKQPMIDLSLFKNSLFSVNLITGLATFVSMGGSLILMPFYLENVLGYGPRAVGLLMATVPVLLGVVAPVSGALSDRIGTRPITVVGLLVLVVGFYAMSSLSTQTTVLGYVLRFLPVGVGMGVFQSPNNSAVMGSVPRRRLGVASGLLSITRTLGQTTGIAILGALWASRVFAYAGTVPLEGATAAQATAQVAGLHDTFLIVTGLLVLALLLGVWGLVHERRMRETTPLQVSP